MKLIIAIVLCGLALVKGNAEFEEYKRTHPEEFSGKTEGDMLIGHTRNAYTNINKWTNGIVVYDMSEMSSNAKRKIKAALQELATKVGSCITFKERTNERNYIKVKNLGGCYSYVGMLGGQQTLSLAEYGCLGAGTIQHEFIHALGFMHEQCRSDRDQYLEIHWENIKQDMQHNFRKLNSNNQGLPYTYESVMQYGQYAFSMNGKPSMTPKKAGAQIGIRKLHNRDVKMLQLFYGCGSGSGNGGNGNGNGGDGGDGDCVDENSGCPSWTSYCDKPGYSHIKDMCRKSCGVCGGSGGGGSNCKDQRTDCSNYKTYGYCTEHYVEWMKSNCQKTCGFCS